MKLLGLSEADDRNAWDHAKRRASRSYLRMLISRATVTHLFVIGGTAVPALVLLALSALVAYVKRGQLASLAGML